MVSAHPGTFKMSHCMSQSKHFKFWPAKLLVDVDVVNAPGSDRVTRTWAAVDIVNMHQIFWLLIVI